MESGREVQEGGACIHLWLIHVDVWQKSKQYGKAIILQLKTNFKKKLRGRSREGKETCLYHKEYETELTSNSRPCPWPKTKQEVSYQGKMTQFEQKNKFITM